MESPAQQTWDAGKSAFRFRWRNGRATARNHSPFSNRPECPNLQRAARGRSPRQSCMRERFRFLFNPARGVKRGEYVSQDLRLNGDMRIGFARGSGGGGREAPSARAFDFVSLETKRENRPNMWFRRHSGRDRAPGRVYERAGTGFAELFNFRPIKSNLHALHVSETSADGWIAARLAPALVNGRSTTSSGSSIPGKERKNGYCFVCTWLSVRCEDKIRLDSSIRGRFLAAE